MRLREQEENQQEKQQHRKKKKKNKCRGNRKLQRYRAKLRKQGLNEETISRLINDEHQHRPPEESHQAISSEVNIGNLMPVRNQVSAIANH